MVKKYIDKLKDKISKKKTSSEELDVISEEVQQVELSDPLTSSQEDSVEPIQESSLNQTVPLEGSNSTTYSQPGWRVTPADRVKNFIGHIFPWGSKKEETTGIHSFSLKLSQSPRFEEMSKAFFSPKYRPLIHRIFLISLAISVPYTAGKMVALFVSPSVDSEQAKVRSTFSELSSSQNYKEQLDRVRLANLFHATSTDPVGGKAKAFVCERSELRTALPIRLMTTIVLQDSVKSIASVQVRGSNEALTLREGDPIESMAEIAKIERMRLLIKNLETGECEYAENEDLAREQRDNKRFTVLNPKKGRELMKAKANEGIRNVGNHFFIKKALREEALKDMTNILTQARAIQMRNPDGTYSFKMTEIVPGSIYSKLNVQDGDIITGINGKKIENVNELMNMFGRIKDIDNLSLTVTREGQEQNLDYEFE